MTEQNNEIREKINSELMTGICSDLEVLKTIGDISNYYWKIGCLRPG